MVQVPPSLQPLLCLSFCRPVAQHLVSTPLSLPVLTLSSRHLFPCSSIRWMLTAASRFISGAGTHMCPVPPAHSSHFTLFLSLSPSIIVFPSVCLTLSKRSCLAVGGHPCWISFLELWFPSRRRPGGEPKHTEIHCCAFSSFYLSICFGEGISYCACVFPLGVHLFECASLIHS